MAPGNLSEKKPLDLPTQRLLSIKMLDPNELHNECRELVRDAVQYKVRGGQTKPYNKRAKIMRRTIDEVLQRHEILFRSMIDKLRLMTNDKSCGRTTFENVAGEIFADEKYNWGRIVTVYAFAVRLAQYYNNSVANYSESHCDLISEYTGDFVVNRLAGWIDSHGGWDEFERHFEENPTETHIWKGVLATAAFGIGAVFAARIMGR